GAWVPVAEVHGPALRLADSRGQRDLDARALDALVVGAHAPDVRGVRHDASRNAREAGHLLHEIVADVIADLSDDVAVGARNPANVRRVDDDLAAVGHDRLDLVDALPSHPEVVVHAGRAAEDRRVRARLAQDVDTAGVVGRRAPRLLR